MILVPIQNGYYYGNSNGNGGLAAVCETPLFSGYYSYTAIGPFANFDEACDYAIEHGLVASHKPMQLILPQLS